MSIFLDATQWPLVLCKFDGEQTIEEVDAYIRRFDAVHARRRPYVGITFMKRYVRGRAITDRMGRWLKESERATRDYCLGAGLISQSATFRFALSAVLLIRPMVCPYNVSSRFADAESYVRAIAAQRGLGLPPVIVNPWPEAA